MVVSAKYGLISLETAIPAYDMRMEHARAEELRHEVMRDLEKFVNHGVFDQIYIDLGAAYMPTVRGMEVLFNGSRIVYAHGRIGERLGRLKAWLRSIERKGTEGLYEAGDLAEVRGVRL